MGIPQLYTFVAERVPNAFLDIDIIEEIENWFRQHNEQPTIVIDFPAFTHAICNNRYDVFFGGRFQNYFNKTEQFFKMFKLKDVKLVFYEDGPVQGDKADTVTERQNKEFNNIFCILDELEMCTNVKSLVEKYRIKLLGSVGAGIRAIAREYGEFHKSYNNECDKEISAYAVNVNAMAVISDDTDFLIYRGNWAYWSSRHIDFSKLTTKCYDKICLRQYLKLNEDEMSLFATLAGNDIMSCDLLKGFHRNIGNLWYKFPNISRYIIRNFRNAKSRTPEIIARHLFGNVKDLPIYTDLVRKSLHLYNINHLAGGNAVSTNISENNFLLRMRSVENDCYAYTLDLARSCTISNFDVRVPPFDKYLPLVLNLIRRQFGIMLQHKNDKTLVRHIYSFENERYVYKTLEPEYPPFLVPHLDDLYNTDKSVELKMIKLQLLVWTISNRLDINAIVTIDKKYFCVCLTLFFMVENSFITAQEADIFLHMIETVYKNFSAIADLPYLEHVNKRAFQIVFLYEKVYQQITHIISNCGLFELIEHNHMDGLFFHYAFNNNTRILDIYNKEQINARLANLRLYEKL